jgi:hypothetical protein
LYNFTQEEILKVLANDFDGFDKIETWVKHFNEKFVIFLVLKIKV